MSARGSWRNSTARSAFDTMHRCLVSPDDWDAPEIALSSEEAHHLLHVMRAADGQPVALFDGCGREASATLACRGRQVLAVNVTSAPPQRRPGVELCLVQCLPKGKRMDIVVEKATEIGAAVIVPTVSERTVVRPKASQAAERVERWRRIALSATRQSRSAWLPEVTPISDFPGAVGRFGRSDVLLVATVASGTRPLRDVLHAVRDDSPSRVALVVGPEGDLTPAEVELARVAGGIAVGFGPRVLRAETAGIYGVSVLAHELLS